VMRVNEMLEDREASQNAEDSPRVGEPRCRCARLPVPNLGRDRSQQLGPASRSTVRGHPVSVSKISLRLNNCEVVKEGQVSDKLQFFSSPLQASASSPHHFGDARGRWSAPLESR
jgi:hypothetical protein